MKKQEYLSAGSNVREFFPFKIISQRSKIRRHMSSAEKLINMFKEKGYDYIILYNNQNKFSNGVLLSNDNYLSSQCIFDTDTIQFPLQEKQHTK